MENNILWKSIEEPRKQLLPLQLNVIEKHNKKMNIVQFMASEYLDEYSFWLYKNQNPISEESAERFKMAWRKDIQIGSLGQILHETIDAHILENLLDAIIVEKENLRPIFQSLMKKTIEDFMKDNSLLAIGK